MIDTGRYQRRIGAIGLILLVAFSVYLYVSDPRHSQPGIAAGRPLPRFVAPLATSDLNAPANIAPRCDPSHPAARGLNVCDRTPIVLAFFALGAKPCIRAVSALQRASRAFPAIQFAAVAAGGARRATAALVRSNHWSIRVAYDSSGSVAQLYDVAVCPLIEVTGHGGTVRRRLIGDRWAHTAALIAALRQVLSESS